MKTTLNISAVQDAFMRPSRVNYRFHGTVESAIRFIRQEQLLDRTLWNRFVQQYKLPDADHDGGWRGEYWGKMMMGACYLCETTQDGSLYKIFEETVRDMLTAQRADGRIATYAESHELTGWDLWCRKNVMIGMEYFLPLCRNEELAQQIILFLPICDKLKGWLMLHSYKCLADERESLVCF